MNDRAKPILTALEANLLRDCHKTPAEATAAELHDALSKAVMGSIAPDWRSSRAAHEQTRRACYLSAEFLVGRAVYNNLLCLGITEDVDALLTEKGASLASLEEVEDAALGNGGPSASCSWAAIWTISGSASPPSRSPVCWSPTPPRSCNLKTSPASAPTTRRPPPGRWATSWSWAIPR